MKTQILLTTLIAMSLFGVGCAKKNNAPAEAAAVAVSPTAPPNPGDSRAPDPGYSFGTSGASASFQIESIQALTAYAATHPLNAPTKFQVNVNVSDIGNGRYAGVVQVSYYDNGNYYNGYFDSGKGNIGDNGGTSYDKSQIGKPEAEFNQWFNDPVSGKKVFHGFFQDQYGAVVLVADESLTGGDGGLPSEMNGTIWFKNFQPTYAQMSTQKCWVVQIGPYDCRTFIGGNGSVNTTQAVNPSVSDGYVKLGKFTGLNVKKAFNVQ